MGATRPRYSKPPVIRNTKSPDSRKEVFMGTAERVKEERSQVYIPFLEDKGKMTAKSKSKAEEAAKEGRSGNFKA